MIKRILLIFAAASFCFVSNPVFSKDLSSKALNNYLNKISNKFSRTYCNSIQFGISNEGALAFAIGETNKEFKNNKLNKLIDYSQLKNNTIISLENDCQAYDFPSNSLEELKLE